MFNHLTFLEYNMKKSAEVHAEKFEIISLHCLQNTQSTGYLGLLILLYQWVYVSHSSLISLRLLMKHDSIVDPIGI
jgi:hypothetical protein